MAETSNPKAMTVALPAEVPTTGLDIEVNFNRIPEESYAIVARLGETDAAAPAYMYGRGRGSNARQKAHLVVHIDAETALIARLHHENRVTLVAEDLSGIPLDLVGMNIASVRIR